MRILKFLGTLLGALGVCNAALGAPMFPKMYDVSYIFETPAGDSSIRMISDGKGHLREETRSGGRYSVAITDFSSKTRYLISDAIRLVAKSPLPHDYEGEMNADLAVKKGAKNLGVKTIKGLACQGWSYNQNGSEAEVWVEKTDGFIVLSTGRSPAMTTKMELTSSRKDVPSPDLFAIPSGYRVVNAR